MSYCVQQKMQREIDSLRADNTALSGAVEFIRKIAEQKMSKGDPRAQLSMILFDARRVITILDCHCGQCNLDRPRKRALRAGRTP